MHFISFDLNKTSVEVIYKVIKKRGINVINIEGIYYLKKR